MGKTLVDIVKEKTSQKETEKILKDLLFESRMIREIRKVING